MNGSMYNGQLYIKNYTVSGGASCWLPQCKWPMSLRNIWATDDRRKICPLSSLWISDFSGGHTSHLCYHQLHVSVTNSATVRSGLVCRLGKTRTSWCIFKRSFCTTLSINIIQLPKASQIRYETSMRVLLIKLFGSEYQKPKLGERSEIFSFVSSFICCCVLFKISRSFRIRHIQADIF